MREHRLLLASFMLALVLITVGCVPIATPPPEPTPPPFPIGIFTGVGSWTAEYRADGSYISQSPDAVERGTYTVTSDQVVLKGNYCEDTEGTYIWSFDGDALSFKAVDDQCVDRRKVMEASSWIKQP